MKSRVYIPNKALGVYSRRVTCKSLILSNLDEALDSLYKYAQAIPQDKLTWETDGARSVMSMVQECVQAPMWTIHMLETRSVGNFDEAAFAEMMAERAQWDTLEKCEAETRARLAKLRAAIEAFPDEDLEATLFLPFTMKDHPYWDIMMYPYWNMVWHTGQIAYIQTMLGDRDMY